jgi:hypothetical protein
MKYHTQSRRKLISYIQYKEEKLTGLVISCVGTAFYSAYLKGRYRDAGTGSQVRRRKQLLDDLKETRGKRKHYIPLYAEFAMDLS